MEPAETNSRSAPKVSVVVVSFNTREKLRRCLSCLGEGPEIVVVDNASEDGSVEMVRRDFPTVRLVENNVNVGFGPANNQGCDVATGDLILFLNSDAYAEPGAVDRLARVFADPGVVAAGGRLLNPDGTLQMSTATELTLWVVFCEQTWLEKVFRGSTLFSPYWTTRRNEARTEPWPTDQVMGASLMVRAERGQPVERFDPRYFFYVEDTDLCRRLRRHGQILYVPAARFVHELGSSSARDPALGIIRYNRGKELYFLIHHGRLAAIVCFLLDRLGAVLRLAAYVLMQIGQVGTSRRAQQMMSVFWRVLTAPGRYREASTGKGG